jgi:chemotaxis protein methyltransferase CheR
VLIYFDQATKTVVLDRICKVMSSDGFLYLGGAETVLGISERFHALTEQRGIYSPMARATQGERAAAVA